MALFEKLNRMAKNIGDKAGDAVEITKLTGDITLENNALNGDLKKIGEFYYNIFARGGEVAPEVIDWCNSAKVRYENIAVKQAEIERIKAENEAEKAAEKPQEQPVVQQPEGVKCLGCGAVNAPGTKFCAECGTKLEIRPPAEPQRTVCPSCNAQVAPGTKFCPECGMKI